MSIALRLHRSLFLLGAVSALAVHGAEAPLSTEERLRRLESTVESLQAENAALRRELGAAAPGDAAKARPQVPLPGGKEAQLIVGGFLQAQAEFGDEGDNRFAGTNDRFYFRRARMYLAGSFAEHFLFKVEGEFATNSTAASTGLRASGNEIYIGWNRFPAANVRVGQLKPAFGGEQLLPDTKAPTVERYLGSDRLTDPRQLGMSVGGDIVPGRLSYLVVVGNGNGPNSSANDNNRFMQTGRLFGVAFDRQDIGRLILGANAIHTDDEAVTRPSFNFDSLPGGAIDNIFAGHRSGWGADAQWHFGRADLSAEFLRMQFEPRNRLPLAHFSADAWEAMGAYFLVPNTLQAVARHEYFDPNTSWGGDATENWVVGLNYLIKGEDLRLMVDYLFGHSPDSPDGHGRLLTRFQIIF